MVFFCVTSANIGDLNGFNEVFRGEVLAKADNESMGQETTSRIPDGCKGRSLCQPVVKQRANYYFFDHESTRMDTNPCGVKQIFTESTRICSLVSTIMHQIIYEEYRSPH